MYKNKDELDLTMEALVELIYHQGDYMQTLIKREIFDKYAMTLEFFDFDGMELVSMECYSKHGQKLYSCTSALLESNFTQEDLDMYLKKLNLERRLLYIDEAVGV